MSVDRPDEDLAARLGAYLDGELPPAEAAEVEGLLFRDAAAGQLYRGMKADRALLSADLNAAANRPAGDLLAVIDREFAARQRGPAGGPAVPRGRAWWPQAAAAAAVLVLAIGGAGWWTESRIGSATNRLEASHETVRGEIQAAVSRALETQVSGQTVAWSGEGISGEVTPIRTYRSASGDWCREYLRSTRLQGRELSIRGLACRNADGEWVTVKAEPEQGKPGDAGSGGAGGQERL